MNSGSGGRGAAVADYPARGKVPSAESGRLLLRVPEVAERLGLGLTKTWDLVNRGSIPSIQIGRSRRVRADDLAAWVREHA